MYDGFGFNLKIFDALKSESEMNRTAPMKVVHVRADFGASADAAELSDYQRMKTRRLGQTQEIKSIKMSRVSPSPKIAYTMTPARENIVSEFDLDYLRESLKNTLNKPRASSARRNSKKEPKKVVIQYDDDGRLSPQEPYKKLNASDMKDLAGIVQKLSNQVQNIEFNRNTTDVAARTLFSIYNDLSNEILSKISDDVCGRCNYVGNLLKGVWDVMTKVICQLIEIVGCANESSRDVLSQSMKDYKMFNKQLIEISKRPPKVIEKEVVIEKPVEILCNDKTERLEKDLESALEHCKRYEADVNREKSSRLIWQTAAIDLCKLDAPSTRPLFEKQKKWADLGQEYVDQCKLKANTLFKSATDISERWNSECVQIYTLSYKAQATLLLHIKVIADSTQKLARDLSDDIIRFQTGKLFDSQQYHQFMMDTRINKMRDDFLAWGSIIGQWMDLETSPLVIESRTLSLGLEEDFRQLLLAVENSPSKHLIPEGCVLKLTKLNDQMSKILQRITKPFDEKSRSTLLPISTLFRDFGNQFDEVTQGKNNNLLQMNGFVDSYVIKTLSKKLELAATSLQTFCKNRNDDVKAIQIAIPGFTFDIRSSIEELTGETNTSLSILQSQLNENIDIATAWSFLYGAGLKGPFKLVASQMMDSNFVDFIGRRFISWIDTLHVDFDWVLHPSAFEEFELLINDWFGSTKELLSQHGQFFYAVETQTDPVVVNSMASCGDLNLLSSSSSQVFLQGNPLSSSTFFPILQRVETVEELMLAPVMELTPVSSIFEAPPVTLDVEPVVTKQETFAQTQPYFASLSHQIKAFNISGRQKPISWLYNMMNEFYEYRNANMIKIDIGYYKIYHHPQSIQDNFNSFASMKYGVKKAVKQLNNEIESSILRSKEEDPEIFGFYMFKSGAWSQFCFDFYLMCRANLKKERQIDFIERMFFPFGTNPIASALSAQKIYKPKNNKELLIFMATCFTAVLAGHRHESMSLFKTYIRDGYFTTDCFMNVLSKVGYTGSIDSARQICQCFVHGKKKSLDFEDFEVCALYCGFFSQPSIGFYETPFIGIKLSNINQIEEAFEQGKDNETLSLLSNEVPRMITNSKLSDYEIKFVLNMMIQTARITSKTLPNVTSDKDQDPEAQSTPLNKVKQPTTKSTSSYRSFSRRRPVTLDMSRTTTNLFPIIEDDDEGEE